MSKRLWSLMGILTAAALVLSACAQATPTQEAPEEAALEKVKACFIYVGPIGDYGWTHAHDQGRLYVDEQFANNANSVVIDSYFVANLRAGYDLQLGSWLIGPFVGVNNLFDETYIGNVRINAAFDRYYEPAPDRNAYGGVSIRYEFRM